MASKSHRRYHSPLREKQARETHQMVLAAAHRAFMSDGWAKTTIAVIAAEAKVSKETIYATFGSKRAILQLLVERALRGAAPDTPLLEQPGPRSIAKARDPHRQLALFAADISAILERVAPLIAVVRAAAENEPEMASLYATLHRGRYKNLEFVTNAILANGRLRRGLDRASATAIIWRLASPELFLLLRKTEGLSLIAYREWLATSLSRLLLPIDGS